MKYRFFITIVLFFPFFSIFAQDNLHKAWEIQAKPLKHKVISFSFSDKRNELVHGYAPWHKTLQETKGNIWITQNSLYKKESKEVRGKEVLSLLQYDQKTMLFSNFGSDTLSTVTIRQYNKQLYQTARYSPTLLLEYFNKKKSLLESAKDSKYNTYLETIGEAKVRLFINKTTNLVDKINILENDDFLGDVSSSFQYNYKNEHNLFVPLQISISKTNGKLQDTVLINSFKIEDKLPSLLTSPSNYTLKEDIEVNPQITLEKYNEHIYFLYLEHTDSKSLVVVFDNFILVAEAPLNSKNGDLMINTIKKEFPNKPIKYFTFGHHHPHYLGGMRSFIHEGSTILSPMGDFDYVSYLAKKTHSLKPDSLQLNEKRLDINILGEAKTITDDSYSMQIINIGEYSAHTKDYIIFYFPEEKLLFQGDLVWIRNNADPIRKASARQKGLYDAIKKWNLDVDTILQSWPIKEFNVKSKISFKELEESVKI